MHSSRMRTARGSGCPRGGLPQCAKCGPGDPPLGVGLGDTPGVGLETPLGVGLKTPPGQTPSTSHLGVGLETPPAARHAGIPPPCCNACWDTTTPLQGMLGYHLQCVLGYHPPTPPWTDRHL